MGGERTRAKNLRLQGIVVDDNAVPIAGAEVQIWPELRKTQTSADGTFTFDKLAAQQYRVSALKDDYYAEPTVTRPTNDSDALVVLRLRRGATLRVHVVGEHAPVGGAQVVLGVSPSSARRTIAFTDSLGTANVHGLGRGYHDVRVEAEGWVPGFFDLQVDEDAGGLVKRTVTLKRGFRVGGFVLGPNNEPIPDANVVFWNGDKTTWLDETTTDESGAWHLEAVASGEYSLTASAKGFADADYLPLDFSKSGPTNVVLRLKSGGSLRGEVVDVKGNPILGAEVEATIQGGGSTHIAQTKPDGTFELLGLGTGTYEVFARTNNQASKAQRISIKGADHSKFTLVVQESSIAGVVVDSQGSVVPEIVVRANAVGGHSMTNDSRDVTDSRGHFELGGLEPGEYAVTAQWPDQRTQQENTSQLTRTGDNQVKIVMRSMGTIRGRVVWKGEPLPYYGIALSIPGEISWLNLAPTGISTQDGRFTLSNIGTGTWTLVILGPGTDLKIISELRVEEGQLLELGDVVMAPGQRIVGRVQDSAGSPVANAYVTIGRGLSTNGTQLRQWVSGDFETTTDANGRYVFEGIATHRSTLRAPMIQATHSQHGKSLAQHVPTNNATVNLTLLGVGSVDGLIEDFDGKYSTVTIQRSDEPESIRWTPVHRLGKFAFEDIPIGDYEVAIDEYTGLGSSTKITVVPNRRVSATLRK